MSSKLCAFSVNRFLKIAGAEVEAKTEPINERELVLDGGFLITQTNSFGHMFRFQSP